MGKQYNNLLSILAYSGIGKEGATDNGIYHKKPDLLRSKDDPVMDRLVALKIPGLFIKGNQYDNYRGGDTPMEKFKYAITNIGYNIIPTNMSR